MAMGAPAKHCTTSAVDMGDYVLLTTAYQAPRAHGGKTRSKIVTVPGGYPISAAPPAPSDELLPRVLSHPTHKHSGATAEVRSGSTDLHGGKWNLKISSGVNEHRDWKTLSLPQ